MIESHAGEHGEVRGKELNESEPCDEVSLAKIDHIKTRGLSRFWENGRGNLFTDCWVCGVEAARTCLRLSGEREKQAWDVKGKYQARHAEVESTDACVCGGLLRSSFEAAVMAVERRGQRTVGSLN